jgi:DNA-binding LacI/PurR family transcriptional regulator
MSVRQIAKSLHVSIATVSRALNNHPEINPETRARVLKIANEIGYFNNVGKRVTTNIGLVYTSDMGFSEYDALLMAGVLRGVVEQKFDVTIVNIERDKQDNETYTQFFMRKGLRGVILRTLTRSRHICQAIAAEGCPMVVVAERFDDPNVNYICYHSGDDSRRAVEHLVHLGHRRIALAIHSISDSDHADRQHGYRQALEANGIAYDRELVFPLIANVDGGIAAMNRIMSLPEPPTAVYFTDPQATLGAMRRAHAMGLRIPDDLSIVGFDDGDMRNRVFPPLTAVCQTVEALGFEAALWLTRKIAGMPAPPMQKVAATFFEVNQTTGLPPKSPVRVLPDGTRMAAAEWGRPAS